MTGGRLREAKEKLWLCVCACVRFFCLGICHFRWWFECFDILTWKNKRFKINIYSCVEVTSTYLLSCSCGYFYLRSLPLKGTTWIPRGPPSFDTSTSLTMSLGGGGGRERDEGGGRGEEGGEGWHRVREREDDKKWDKRGNKNKSMTTKVWIN